MAKSTAPKSPISLLAAALAASPRLTECSIYLGINALARQTKPGRIVLWPAESRFVPTSDKANGILDVVDTVRMQCWADDVDAVWDLRARVVQAVNAYGADGGPWWDFQVGSWNSGADTQQQGTSIELLLTFQSPISSVDQDEGHVGAEWSSGVVESEQLTYTIQE